MNIFSSSHAGECPCPTNTLAPSIAFAAFFPLLFTRRRCDPPLFNIRPSTLHASKAASIPSKSKSLPTWGGIWIPSFTERKSAACSSSFFHGARRRTLSSIDTIAVFATASRISARNKSSLASSTTAKIESASARPSSNTSLALAAATNAYSKLAPSVISTIFSSTSLASYSLQFLFGTLTSTPLPSRSFGSPAFISKRSPRGGVMKFL